MILASGSPYRAQLLRRLRLDFEAWSPDIDESLLPGETPARGAVRLARLKAEAGTRAHPGRCVIGSDQVADRGGHAVNKPCTVEGARAQLRELRGQHVLFHTAVCLIGATGRRQERLVTTDVVFRPLTDAEIDRYVELEPAADCAGSAKAEGLGISLLARLGGDDPTALVGLPLIALSQMLRAEGFCVP
ncbi:MAG: Maf family protein [Betaproteobacteria bacterium]